MPLVALFFYWVLIDLDPLLVFWATWVRISTSFETSLPSVLSLFLFFLLNSIGEARDGIGVGGLRSTGTSGVAPLAWDSNSASRLGVFFWITIPSGMSMTPWLALTYAVTYGLELVLECSVRSSWLKTSKSFSRLIKECSLATSSCSSSEGMGSSLA